MRWLWIFAVLAASPALAVGSQPQTDSRTADTDRRTATIVEAADRALQQAFVRADLKALEAAYADTYTFTDPNGRVSGKQEMIAGFESGAIKIAFQEISDVKVQVYGNAAIVTGVLTSRATRDGRDSGGTYRFTRVWVNQNGKWQTVAFQETRPQ
jgi:ketosteroid isomerase-like protein